MVFSNMTIKELLSYSEPKTELEIALYEKLKEAQEEIIDLQDCVTPCGTPEL